MAKIRFGLIGCGVIHAWHAEVIKNLGDDAELVAVCDIVPERAQASVQKWGGEAYTDYRKLLRRKDIDAVVIATPSGLHADMAIAALKAGKHVIVEKPIDVDLRKARALAQLARKSKRKLTVISQTRYGAGIAKLHEWLDAGKLGRLVYGEAAVKWYRTQEYYDSGDWRGTWKLDGGGALMNQGVHYADQLVWAMGPIKSLSAYAATLGHERIEVEDVVTASIVFKSGALGSLTATTCAYPGFETALEVFGTEGSVRTVNGEIVAAAFKDGTTHSAESESPTAGGAADPAAISYYGHTRQFANFIAAIREDRSPWLTAQTGCDALEFVIGVYKSAFSGKSVEFPLPAKTGRGK
jgi:predicted dehydrogenase